MGDNPNGVIWSVWVEGARVILRSVSDGDSAVDRLLLPPDQAVKLARALLDAAGEAMHEALRHG